MHAVIQQIGYSNHTFKQAGRVVPKLWLLVAFWRTQADHDAGLPQVLVEDFLLTHRALRRRPDDTLVPFDVAADVLKIIARHALHATASGRVGHFYNVNHRASVPMLDPEGTLTRPEVAALVGRAVTEIDAL